MIRSDINSSQKLDTQGTVCDMLDFPAVKSRSTAPVNFISRSAPAHTLVVLAYFLDDLGRDNLQFFLAQGLVPESSYHFVVVINGDVSEIWTARLHRIAESYPNFEWYSRENVGYDFCAYKDALSKRTLKVSIKDIQYFVLINKSMRGPFLPSYYDKPWPEVFTSRLHGDIKLSGTTINCGNPDGNQDTSWITMHVQSMLWAFRANLLPELVGRLQCHADKGEAIRSIEVGFPAALLARGFRLASTMRMLDAREGVPDANTAAICAWAKGLRSVETYGDSFLPGQYAGIDLSPLETVFFKANRGVGDAVLRQHTAFALMNRNFTASAALVCGAPA